MNAVVVGAGIIGLSVALELAERGASVRVFDRDEPVRAASWAAAGMLAPRTEIADDAAMQSLCERSLSMYETFAHRVASLSGVDVQLRLDGILHAAFDDASLHAMQQRHDVRALTRREILSLEPVLASDVRGGVLVEGEGQIDNRRLGRALVAACERSGVTIETRAGALHLEFDDRRVLGVRSAYGFTAADVVVNAAGAWASHISGVPGDCVVPVHAVKGQMFALVVPVGLMHRAVWIPGAYLVPRADGRVLVGATVESDDDTRVTSAAIDALLHSALRAAPALGKFGITEMWAGLRPGTPDARPILGATARAGYYLATGHYRNGILLAPLTAQLVSDAIEGSAVPAEFALERFARTAKSA